MVIYAEALEETEQRVKAAGGTITKGIFSFPEGVDSISPTLMVMVSRCGPTSSD